MYVLKIKYETKKNLGVQPFFQTLTLDMDGRLLDIYFSQRRLMKQPTLFKVHSKCTLWSTQGSPLLQGILSLISKDSHSEKEETKLAWSGVTFLAFTSGTQKNGGFDFGKF